MYSAKFARMASPRSLDAFLSSDVDLQVKLLVLNLHGACPALLGDEPGLSYAECISRVAGVAASDLYISCQLHTHGRPFGLPERTCNTPGSRLRWNEWVGFNAKYRDLSPDAHVTLTLVGSSGPRATRTLGTARLALFDEAQQLRMGVCKMQVRMCSGLAAAGATDGGGLQDGSLEGGGLGADQEAELGEIEAASARHEASLAQPTPGLAWLDRPTYTYLETRRQALDSQLANPTLPLPLSLPLALALALALPLPRRSTHSWRATSSSRSSPTLSLPCCTTSLTRTRTQTRTRTRTLTQP